MDAKKLCTYIGIGGGVLGGVASVLGIVQTVDEMKNGVKLRDDQMESMTVAISNKVSNNIVASYGELAANIVVALKSDAEKSNKGQN